MKHFKTFSDWLSESEDDKMTVKAPDKLTMAEFLAAINEDPEAPLYNSEAGEENTTTFFEITHKSRKVLEKIMGDHPKIKKA